MPGGICHGRNDDRGIVARKLHGMSNRGIPRSLVDAVGAVDIGQKQATESTIVQQARQIDPVVDIAIAARAAVERVLPRAAETLGWSLGGDGRTVAVRIPKHPLALALLAVSGPLAVTSANRSGAPPLEDAEALAAVFDEEVAVYLCQDGPLAGAASTVVDLMAAEPRILRTGALSAADIARFLAGEGPLLDSRPSP